ncbi:MAG: hypothetical protein OEM63_04225 [Gammaproteobacteria bacterium]|nr:hypothetical protein [Gammaproteobacteria bacterium]
MKRIFPLIAVSLLGSACATGPSDGPRRSQIRDCPVGMVLVCVSASDQVPSKGGDEEEIPQYDRCYCEDVM